MTPRNVFLSIRNFDGVELKREKLETSKKVGGLDFWRIGDSCLLLFNPVLNTIGLHISRTMSKSADGLNH